MAHQLLIHTDHMSEIYQSAYKPQHSTTLHRDCIVMCLQRHKEGIRQEKDCTTLVMIDLSAAFDTIDHHILLHLCDTGMGFQVLLLNG